MNRVRSSLRACLVLLLAALLATCSAPTPSPLDGTTATSPAASSPAGPRPQATPRPEVAALAEGQATAAGSTPAAAPRRGLVLTTTEDGAALDFVRTLAAGFSAAEGWAVEVVPKGIAELRLDLETAALAGQAPDLLWTTGDQIWSLAATELLQPVDQFFVPADFAPVAVTAAKLDDTQWGIPLATGDQLMLLFNRGLLPAPPRTTDELLNLPRPAGAEVLLVADQSGPFWLAPWLGGFGGRLVGDDNRPALYTPEMINTLGFLRELRDKEVVPAEIDLATGDALFRAGQAAMLATSAWMAAAYANPPEPGAPDLDLGVAPLPIVSPTQRPPVPYVAGVHLLVTRTGVDQRRDAVQAFVAYVTHPDVQARFATELRRLPALAAVLQSDTVQGDPQLKPIADALPNTVPLSGHDELRRALEAIGAPLAATLAGEITPEEAAQEMQAAAEAALAD